MTIRRRGILFDHANEEADRADDGCDSGGGADVMADFGTARS